MGKILVNNYPPNLQQSLKIIFNTMIKTAGKPIKIRIRILGQIAPLNA